MEGKQWTVKELRQELQKLERIGITSDLPVLIKFSVRRQIPLNFIGEDGHKGKINVERKPYFVSLEVDL